MLESVFGPVDSNGPNAAQLVGADDHLVIQSTLRGFLALRKALDFVAADGLVVEQVLGRASVDEDDLDIMLVFVLDERRVRDPLTPLARLELEILGLLAFTSKAPMNHLVVSGTALVGEQHNGRAGMQLGDSTLLRIGLATLEGHGSLSVDAGKRGTVYLVEKLLGNVECKHCFLAQVMS